jgi:uncharacterized protein (TIGR02145 family)
MKKMIFSMLMLLIASVASMNAQVRIGGLEDPHQSAVLDLNEDDEANEGNFGFALPRVFLREKNQKLNNAKPADGTVIYNTNSDYARGRGIYFWTDSLWVRAASYTLREGDTIRVLEKPIIKVVEPQPAEGLGVQFAIDGNYADNGSVYRYEWTVLSSDPLVNPLPTPTSQTSKMDLITVPFDDTPRTYEVKARAIADGYNDPKEESDPVWSTVPGKFKPEFRMTGQDFYDIAATNYTNPTQYGRWDYRTTHKLIAGTGYTYEIVGTELEDLNYTWSVVDNDNLLTTASKNAIATANTSSVNLQFNDLSESTFVNGAASTAKLSATLQCEVKIGDGTYYEQPFEKVISVGDYDECSWGIGLKDSEDNSYTVSRFGDVCWMTQNLRSKWTIQNDQQVNLIENNNGDNSNTDPFYYYPNGNQSVYNNNLRYGLLYSWAAANVGSADASDAFPNQPSTRQGICPEGWVIPSDWDWSNLEKEIATNPGLYSSQETPFPNAASYNFHTSINWRPDEGTTETSWGRQMKAEGTTNTGNRVNGTNPAGSSNNDGSGFNALLVGYLVTGSPTNYGTATAFWSSSSSSGSGAWRRCLTSYSSSSRTAYSKSYWFSVRCKKNDN